MFSYALKKIFGTQNERELKRIQPLVERVNSFEDSFRALSDADLQGVTPRFHRPGVLFKVSNLFRRRGYNIQGITVGTVEGTPLSRMTVTVEADSRVLNQIVEQLDKMVDVVMIKRLDPIRTVSRELLLVKLRTTDPMARLEALNLINTYHGSILDIEPDTLIAEVTGAPTEIDEFLGKVSPVGIEEMSRTGATAIERGMLKLS